MSRAVLIDYFQLNFYVNQSSSLLLWVHDKGLHKSELPYCSNWVQVLPNTTYNAKVDLTLSTSVEYDGKTCISDPNYNQDDCRFDTIHKV